MTTLLSFLLIFFLSSQFDPTGIITAASLHILAAPNGGETPLIKKASVLNTDVTKVHTVAARKTHSM